MKKLKFKRKQKFINEQLDILEAEARRAKVGSDDWQKCIYLRDKLIKQKNDEKVVIPWKDILEIGLRVAEIALNVGLVVYGYKLYAEIAELSYSKDAAMELCNGRVFGMKDQIVKLIPKKV